MRTGADVKIVENLLRLKGFDPNTLGNYGQADFQAFENKENGFRIVIDTELGGWSYKTSTGQTLMEGQGDEQLINMLRDLRYHHKPSDYLEFPEGS